ncbi:hypothetical protein A3Q56_04858 [Intoshia linei]|uniref:Otopetrin-2 n=1 Tax=Intoshia linei TaxID=1819745 RepID=A0A177AZG6_9BILA|nr:hypothetical protein A3Q56_04858 [Intoshia linei]
MTKFLNCFKQKNAKKFNYNDFLMCSGSSVCNEVSSVRGNSEFTSIKKKPNESNISRNIAILYAIVLISISFIYPLIKDFSYIAHSIGGIIYEGYLDMTSLIFIIFIKYTFSKKKTQPSSDEHTPLLCKSNKYLRVGTIIFFIGTIILDILKMVTLFTSFEGHSSPIQVCDYGYISFCLLILHIIFMFAQTHLLFTNNESIYNHLKPTIRFIYCHLIAVNLSRSILVIVQETKNQFSEYNLKAGQSNQCNNVMISIKGSLVEKASVYLFPCIIEYSLVQVAVLYKMFLNSYIKRYLKSKQVKYEISLDMMKHKVSSINEYNDKHISKTCQHLQEKEKSSEALLHMGTISKYTMVVDQKINDCCSESVNGFFIGIIFVVLTALSFILYIFSEYNFELLNIHLRDGQFQMILYYLIQCILFIASGIAVIIGFHRSKRLKYDHIPFCRRSQRVDSHVLFVCILAIAVYYGAMLFNINHYEESFDNHRQQIFHTIGKFLWICRNVLSVLQALIQTIYIADNIHRKLRTLQIQKGEEPGKSITMFLIIINLCIWFISTFELREIDSKSPFHTMFTKINWENISTITLPFIIFFRFHSASCLSEVWHESYKTNLIT